MDGTRIRVLGALAVAALIPLLSGCGAVDGLFTQTPAVPDVFEIAVGDCLDDRDVPNEVTAVPIVDCDEPHDSEVFARTLAAGATFLPHMQFPPEVRSVVIGADNDPAGVQAAHEAARAFAARGLSVRIIRPLDGFKDFNDELRGARA